MVSAWSGVILIIWLLMKRNTPTKGTASTPWSEIATLPCQHSTSSATTSRHSHQMLSPTNESCIWFTVTMFTPCRTVEKYISTTCRCLYPSTVVMVSTFICSTLTLWVLNIKLSFNINLFNLSFTINLFNQFLGFC